MYPCPCLHIHALKPYPQMHPSIHWFVYRCTYSFMHLFIYHLAPPLFGYLRTQTDGRPYRDWRGTYVCILLIRTPRMHLPVCMFVCMHLYISLHMYVCNVSVYASMYLCIRMYIYVWCGLVSRLMYIRDMQKTYITCKRRHIICKRFMYIDDMQKETEKGW